jgi:large subunit ribosomal protein L17
MSRTGINAKPHHARMMARNLVTSILLYESIRTTRKRAKAIQPTVDRLIANAKKMEPRNAIRSVNAFVNDKNACKKLMEVFVQRYAKRSSGFTRIVPVGARKGDGAELVDLILVDSETRTASDSAKA